MGSTIYSWPRARNVYLYGGHDPEDFQHQVGEAPTVLDLHLIPGYRLILNVLFPAARKKKQDLIYNKLLK
jgi:hypothetical protein